MQAFAVSAGVLGPRRRPLRHYNAFIAADSFQPLITIYVVLALTAGGTGTMRGAILGAVLVVALTEGTRFLGRAAGLSPVQVAALRRPPSAPRSSSSCRSGRKASCPNAAASFRGAPMTDPAPHYADSSSPRMASATSPPPVPGGRPRPRGLRRATSLHRPIHHPGLRKCRAVLHATFRTPTRSAAASPSPTVPGCNRSSAAASPISAAPATISRTVFYDYELIWSLGCESVLNMPVRWRGHTAGTLNLLHRAGWYDESDISTTWLFAHLALPAMRLISRS